MKINFKRTLSLVLTVLMIIAVVPFSGMATDGECAHNYTYTNIVSGTHSAFCILCKTGDYVSCSGGTAECGKQKECEFCHTPYGEILSHVFTAKVETEEFLADAADCQTFQEYYYSCANEGCGEKSETPFTSETNKGAHAWDEGVSNEDATCTADGTKDITCTVCGTTETVADEDSALGHDFSEEIIDEAHFFTPATCQQRARYFKDCSRCDFNAKDLGEDADRPVFETDLADHTFEIPAAPIEGTGKDRATCTSPATYYMVCSECGTSAQGKDETAFYEYGGLAEHIYINNAQEKYIVSHATCTSQAIYSKSCEFCGIAAVVNSDGEDLTTPGFDPSDITLEVYIEGEAVPEGSTANAFRWGSALNHGKTFISKDAKAPDCTNDGNTEEVTCDYCKVVLTESKKIDKLGHEYAAKPTQEYKAPTCKQYGQIGKIDCVRCKTTFAINEKGEFMSVENLKTFRIEPIGHIDENEDLVCDRPECGSLLEPEDLCTCLCHGTGLMFFVGFILKWFWKLTGAQPYCRCGIQHYTV